MHGLLSSRVDYHITRLGIFLLVAALVLGVTNCAPIQHTLSVRSTLGGSVAVPGEGEFFYRTGKVVELVAEAEEGYRFVNWTGEVDTVGNVDAASTTIRVEGDYTVTANFIAEYNLAISTTEGGQVTAPGEGTFTYEAGMVVELVAEAEEGYRFFEWTGDTATIVNRYLASTAVTMNGDYSISAMFVAVYELSVSSTEGGSATAPGEGTFTYDDGEVVSLVATSDIGYLFVNWTGDVDTVADVNAASTTITMNGPYVVAATFEAEEAVFFADLNLEAAIREAIDVPERPIYPSDLEDLSSFRADGRSISDITGLEYCVSLIELHLQDNQISDLSPLAGLTSLTWLSLGSNQIRDISPLDGLTNLGGLSLGSNQIGDISPLAGLTSLTWLSLWGNHIADISPLAALANLTWLYLEYNQISDVSPLANLTRVTEIYLGRNQISDISCLANLTNLTHLDLGGNQISDLSPLTSLTDLTWLHIFENRISDIAPLENLTNLTNLHLGGNQIGDVSPLGNLTRLTGLDLSGNQISDLAPIANLTNLRWLFLGATQVSDVSPLVNLTNLRWLDLGDNGLRDISALADMTGLTELRLDTNQISDISPLADLSNLTYLRLWGNQIRDVSPLANSASLTELDLGVNRISDLSPLANLPDLTHLYLNGNRISDMSPLANLTDLSWLSLWNNQIGDVTPLANLTSITVLELGGNKISDITPLVENEGFAEGDYVDLRWNPLSSDSTDILIPQLQARGVKFNPEFPVVETCPCLLDTEWIQNPATGNYYALTSPMSWMAAEGCAQAWGGHLVTLNSWEEELWVKNTFGWHESFWIGFSAIGREHRAGHFVWSSGEPVIYTNWNLGEPNNYRGEDCAVMNAGDGWNDLSRHGHHRAVIEVSDKPG